MTVESDTVAGATIELLEARLRRLSYLLTGSSDWIGVPNTPSKPTTHDETVSRRLARLEKELEKLSRSVPAVRDIIQLRSWPCTFTSSSPAARHIPYPYPNLNAHTTPYTSFNPPQPANQANTNRRPKHTPLPPRIHHRHNPRRPNSANPNLNRPLLRQRLPRNLLPTNITKRPPDPRRAELGGAHLAPARARPRGDQTGRAGSGHFRIEGSHGACAAAVV
jgi:hypothetical protein